MVEGGVVGGGLVERPGDPKGSGTVSGYRVVSGPGEVPDPGVSSEVGERPVVAAGAEGSEVSSVGEVGSGVEEGSGVSAAPTVASRVDTGRPGVEVRSALSREAGSGLGGRVSAGGEVASVDRDAARGVSCGAAWEATGGPREEAGGAVLAAVGRSRRSGPGFFPGPAYPRNLGAGRGSPGLLVVPVVRVGPGAPVVAVPVATAPPEGVSLFQEGSEPSSPPGPGRRLISGEGTPGLRLLPQETVCPGAPAAGVPWARSSPEVGSQVQAG